MAWDFYMNMEKLSLTIAKEHLVHMTDDNFYDDIFLDEEKLINNIKNGFVIITQVSCFLESFLNTIIDSCMEYRGKTLLECSIEEKIEIIFMYYKVDWSVIKGRHYWGTYKKVKKVRNEMIHYKETFLGQAGHTPDFTLGRQPVSEFFTRTNMESIIDQYIKLGDEIAAVLGLKTYHDIDIIGSDAKDTLVNYVYDPNKVASDEDELD